MTRVGPSSCPPSRACPSPCTAASCSTCCSTRSCPCTATSCCAYGSASSSPCPSPNPCSSTCPCTSGAPLALHLLAALVLHLCCGAGEVYLRLACCGLSARLILPKWQPIEHRTGAGHCVPLDVHGALAPCPTQPMISAQPASRSNYSLIHTPCRWHPPLHPFSLPLSHLHQPQFQPQLRHPWLPQPPPPVPRASSSPSQDSWPQAPVWLPLLPLFQPRLLPPWLLRHLWYSPWDTFCSSTPRMQICGVPGAALLGAAAMGSAAGRLWGQLPCVGWLQAVQEGGLQDASRAKPDPGWPWTYCSCMVGP